MECLESSGVLVDLDENDDIDLMEYGFDSMSFISFIVEVEDALKINLPDDFLLVDILRSLNGFVNLIVQIKNDCNQENSVT